MYLGLSATVNLGQFFTLLSFLEFERPLRKKKRRFASFSAVTTKPWPNVNIWKLCCNGKPNKIIWDLMALIRTQLWRPDLAESNVFLYLHKDKYIIMIVSWWFFLSQKWDIFGWDCHRCSKHHYLKCIEKWTDFVTFLAVFTYKLFSSKGLLQACFVRLKSDALMAKISNYLTEKSAIKTYFSDRKKD